MSSGTWEMVPIISRIPGSQVPLISHFPFPWILELCDPGNGDAGSPANQLGSMRTRIFVPPRTAPVSGPKFTGVAEMMYLGVSSAICIGGFPASAIVRSSCTSVMITV